MSIVLFLIYLLCTWVTCLPVHSRCTGAFMCLCEVTFYRVRTGHGNPGKSWNFILAFSRTGKSWKINAGPGKSWKTINSCNNVFFKNNFLRDYYWISIS